jgi:hypothetical protein
MTLASVEDTLSYIKKAADYYKLRIDNETSKKSRLEYGLMLDAVNDVRAFIVKEFPHE